MPQVVIRIKPHSEISIRTFRALHLTPGEARPSHMMEEGPEREDPHEHERATNQPRERAAGS